MDEHRQVTAIQIHERRGRTCTNFQSVHGNEYGSGESQFICILITIFICMIYHCLYFSNMNLHYHSSNFNNIACSGFHTALVVHLFHYFPVVVV